MSDSWVRDRMQAGEFPRPALEFGTVLAMGEAMEADATLLARVLPGVEAAILIGSNDLSDEEVGDG